LEGMKAAFKEGKMGMVVRMSARKQVAHSDFHYMRGEALRVLGEHAAAKAHLQKSISFERFNWLCYLALAQAHTALR
jgi:hypothetical protein